MADPVENVTSIAERLARAPEPTLDPPDIGGVKLSDFRAYMPTHNYIFAPSGEMWPGASVNSRLPAMPLVDANGDPVMSTKKGKEDEQVYIPASAWLDKNQAVEQMTWAPGEPQVIRDRLTSDGGWIERPGCSVFNLYRPPIPQIGDPARAVIWLDHVRSVYPEDAQHLIYWLAHRVQRPQEKINHAIVMGGSQGIGKDSLLEPAKRAIGPWNFSEVAPATMIGRFNGFLKSVILRVSEARDLGDFDRYAFYDHMKTYTAAPPDVLRVDEKYRNEHYVLNVCGVIITTNHKTDGIFLPPEDRRHYVAWSNKVKEDFPDEYWSDLWDWYESGGFGHVAAYLRELDLSPFNPKAPPPKTPAFWEIVAAGQPPEDAELADAIDLLGGKEVMTIGQLASAAHSAGFVTFAEYLEDRKNSRSVRHKLDKAGWVVVRNPDREDGLWRIHNRRVAVYAVGTLSNREAIIAAQAMTRGGFGQ